ncbi:hypothetical protein HYPSUDRAFT_776368 [Hypholoma sublateritium FD-334 SS-4]|uniref:Uncharacterized protein n=1 Tax=Hypholoma sublateritium (strain FD-334 SS-4) TaxID=945553 RepID=A0A0D2NPP9_HYPSF|nr:hypothetical protein HYPSUDRAFT_776368 [Hypholoma sublateritium FD-334 SS-4]
MSWGQVKNLMCGLGSSKYHSVKQHMEIFTASESRRGKGLERLGSTRGLFEAAGCSVVVGLLWKDAWRINSATYTDKRHIEVLSRMEHISLLLLMYLFEPSLAKLTLRRTGQLGDAAIDGKWGRVICDRNEAGLVDLPARISNIVPEPQPSLFLLKAGGDQPATQCRHNDVHTFWRGVT